MPQIDALPPRSASPNPADLIPVHSNTSGDTEKYTLGDLTGYPDLGWIAAVETWVYSSWSATTRIGVLTVPTNATTKYTAGMRIKITQATGGTKYGIIVSVSATTLTIFFPSGTTLNNETITTPWFSPEKVPYGFNADPAIWALRTTNTSGTLTAVGATNAWAVDKSISLVVGIGAWYLGHNGLLQKGMTSAGGIAIYSTLSTANNTESDDELSAGININLTATGSSGAHVSKYKNVLLAAQTTYFLNMMTPSGGGTVTGGFDGSRNATIVEAICGYL